MTRYLLILIVSLIGQFVLADSPIVRITTEKDKKSVFTISTIDFKKEVVVKIFDSSKDELFSRTLELNENNEKSFDVTAFPDGSYTFYMADDYREKVTPLIIESGNAIFQMNETSTFHFPVITERNKMVFINALTGSNADVTISLSDSKGTVLFEQEYNSHMSFGKVLDVKALPIGYYNIACEVNGRRYIQAVNLR